MKHPARWLASVVCRWPAPLAAIAMCAAVALAFGIPRLKFETGQDTLLDPASKISVDNLRYQRQFGGDPMLIMFETPANGPRIEQLFTPENRAELERLERDMDANGDYQSILSPLTILKFAQTQIQQRMISQPLKLVEDEAKADADARAASAARGETQAQQDAAGRAARQQVDDAFNAEFGADARRIVDAGAQSLDNPKFVEFVMYGADGRLRPDFAGVFPDDHHALMVARIRGNLSIDETSRAAADARSRASDYRFDGVSALASGPPLLIKEINDKMRSALVVMAVLAVAIMMAVLFGDLPCAVEAAVAAGGARRLHLGVRAHGIRGDPADDGDDLRPSDPDGAGGRLRHPATQPDRGGDPRERVSGDRSRAHVRAGSAPALALAAVAACIGFIVLHISRVPMVRDFGSMLAVGTVIVFLTSVVLVTSVLYLRERTRLGPRTPAAGADRGGADRRRIDRTHGRAAGTNRAGGRRGRARRAVREPTDPDGDGSGEVRAVGQWRAERPASGERRRRDDQRDGPARRDERRQARDGSGRARLDAGVRAASEAAA